MDEKTVETNGEHLPSLPFKRSRSLPEETSEANNTSLDEQIVGREYKTKRKVAMIVAYCGEGYKGLQRYVLCCSSKEDSRG